MIHVLQVFADVDLKFFHCRRLSGMFCTPYTVKIHVCLLFSYYLADSEGKLLQEQKGVVRTNCIDCLDRTNVTQVFHLYSA